jgi:uncharacterized damage-inducible protein DinB
MTASPSDVSDEIQLLDAERARLLDLLAGIPADLRTRRPAADRWSIAEVVEHLARVDKGIARLFATRGLEPTPEPEPDAATARLTPERIALLRDRTRRIEAPERIRPSGTISYEDALRLLEQARAALKEAYAAADPAALDGRTWTHAVIGPLVLRDWVTFIAHHEARHTEQIGEVADSLRNEPGRQPH